jgi:dGTPase
LKAQYEFVKQGDFDNFARIYPLLACSFIPFCKKYCIETKHWEKMNEWKNHSLYNIDNPEDYYKLCIDFISGMSDYYAIKIFDELTKF